jgi:hypothetical protein
MCSGHSPFRADTMYGVMQRIVHDTPRPLRADHPLVPAWLDALVMRLLCKEPQQRFDSADELVQVLAAELAYLQNPLAHAVPQRGWMADLPRHLALRRRRWVIAASLAAGAIVATALYPGRPEAGHQGQGSEPSTNQVTEAAIAASTHPAPVRLPADLAATWQNDQEVVPWMWRAEQLELQWRSGLPGDTWDPWSSAVQALSGDLQQVER